MTSYVHFPLGLGNEIGLRHVSFSWYQPLHSLAQTITGCLSFHSYPAYIDGAWLVAVCEVNRNNIVYITDISPRKGKEFSTLLRKLEPAIQGYSRNYCARGDWSQVRKITLHFFALRKEDTFLIHCVVWKLYLLRLLGVVYPLSFIMDDPALLGEYIHIVFAR